MRLLLDGDGFVYTFGYAAQSKDGDTIKLTMDIDTVTHLIANQINTIHEHLGVDEVVIYLDDGTNYRHELATLLPYKGHRNRGGRPLLYKDIRDYLIRQPQTIVVSGFETDDALGIASVASNGEDIISSLDKDLDMIPGKHYNWRKNKEYTVSEIEGYRFFFTQCITGDRCDNIPSVYQQLIIAGEETKANSLKRGSYLKKAQKELDKLDTYDKLLLWTKEYYKDAGLSERNLLEVGRLLWIRRYPDEMWSLGEAERDE